MSSISASYCGVSATTDFNDVVADMAATLVIATTTGTDLFPSQTAVSDYFTGTVGTNVGQTTGSEYFPSSTSAVVASQTVVSSSSETNGKSSSSKLSATTSSTGSLSTSSSSSSSASSAKATGNAAVNGKVVNSLFQVVAAGAGIIYMM